ncbi:MAG: RimK family alpha-L-glutamate ligase [Dehalococcoidia bacterium]|nr:MAG: RimK family alpha-L-glutamate ligase [Dehalococcoidia bacterium]
MKGWLLYRETAGSAKPDMYSRRRLVQVAQQEQIDLLTYRPEQFDLVVNKEKEKKILVDGKAVPLPDFILPRTGAGTTYFTLAVIRHLEGLGVRSFNSSESIERVKDKLFTQQLLAKHNLPVPKTMLVKFPVNTDIVSKYLGFPLIVKPLSGAQGIGVFLAVSKTRFEDLMQLIEATNSKANIILQEFVSLSKGRDLRVFTIGGHAIACMERKSKRGHLKANYSQGSSVRKIKLTPEIKSLASKASQILGLEIAGIDLLYDGEKFKICEANSSPGFQGLENCCKVDIPQAIHAYIKQTLIKRCALIDSKKTKNTNTSLTTSILNKL